MFEGSDSAATGAGREKMKFFLKKINILNGAKTLGITTTSTKTPHLTTKD
jgi:hypothetical protein